MKAFKKLAAIVLAGVMALAVLTGCSSNDKDTFQKKLNEALDKAGITATMNGAQATRLSGLLLTMNLSLQTRLRAFTKTLLRVRRALTMLMASGIRRS